MIILFNKPYGVISQFSEHNSYASLKDFIPYKNVYPAGRLDSDSEGLLILTDNGVLQNKISNPKNDIYKTYWAQVENNPTDGALEKLRAGLKVKNYFTKPALVKRIIDPYVWEREPPIRKRKHIPTEWIEIKISEGKNRQVRRMTAAISHPTLRLIRVGIGEYKIDKLLPGDFLVIES
jgi:23S rRNA pseudouridine2457 synthase